MDLANTSTSNSTNSSTPDSWSLPPGFAVFALITGGTSNSFLLVTFISRQGLRNSFGVYLMNLLLIDFILVFIHGPFNLIDKYNPNWYLGWKGFLLV
ncbi:hypothetical protein RvY_14119 [Ramazzottius varieornatus]|uniref:G-protein coupled receptors family 1 profile domain-containing protein n=1 Tax=Ramazzottius varieornatus TaxID=947166 RepID=A0A1D1VXJ5_RAMVA|nr:hypothetical protein RvY_14119 [Ramazzottius varieornatus]